MNNVDQSIQSDYSTPQNIYTQKAKKEPIQYISG